jgi:hypothetical protein
VISVWFQLRVTIDIKGYSFLGITVFFVVSEWLIKSPPAPKKISLYRLLIRNPRHSSAGE